MNKNLGIIRTEIIRILNENGKIRGTEILTQVNHDELIYKLTLKYLRRDGYDIGNHKIPEVKKFTL